MRTTLTLDDDVAAALARRRAERGTGLRHEVNELRAGLSATSRPSEESGEAYELPAFDAGRALTTDHREMKALLDAEDVERALRRPA